MNLSDRVLVVGIDEAGYGPVLGPLVVSATAFDVPRDCADRSLWSLLKASICQAHRSAADRRIVITDSKKLHERGDIAAIERTALAVLHAGGGVPASLREFITRVAPHVTENLADYPWYRDANPAMPLSADAGGVRVAGAAMARDAAACGVRLAGLWCEPLFEGHYNRLVDRTRNKAVILLGLTLRLVQRVGEAYPNHELHIHVDKQGGRDHYHQTLMRSFEDRHLRIEQEDGETSVYAMPSRGPAPPWKIGFRAKGETRHMPVALASVYSKYLREAFMSCFNNYWGIHVPGAAPTAGYYNDGLRFLREIDGHLSRLNIDRAMLVRSR